MRPLAVLILALYASTAVAGNLHKCQTRGGNVYYSDKACSTKNNRDRKAVLDQGADPQKPAPPPPQKKKKR